jgi:hypothetical protein
LIWDLTNPEMVATGDRVRVYDWLPLVNCLASALSDLLQVYQPVSGAPLSSPFCLFFNPCVILYMSSINNCFQCLLFLWVPTEGTTDKGARFSLFNPFFYI